jgi:hypothetical protein
MSALTRRDLLKRSAQTTAGLAAAGALSPSGLLSAAAAAEPTLAVTPGSLASVKRLAKWNSYLSKLGGRHTGNASHKKYINDLTTAMNALGWETSREAQTFTHWEATSFGLKAYKGGQLYHPNRIYAASPYPYSGETPAEGVRGELFYAGTVSAPNFKGGAGKIAVVEALNSTFTNEQLFEPWFPPPPWNPKEVYGRSWVATTLSTSQLKTAHTEKCLGVITVLPMAPEDAKGQYLPFKQPLSEMPTLNVDAIVGAQIKELAKASGNEATLSLPATVNKAETTEALLAVLPGANPEEVVVVNTHTDGPCLIEENGALGMLSVAQMLSGRSVAERPCTIAMYFATGHFASGVESSGQYVKAYPELFKKTKAGITFEHLGCPRYIDNHTNAYGPNGEHEDAGVYASHKHVAEIVEESAKAAGATWVAANNPTTHSFFGEGAALNSAKIPMMSFIAGPDFLLAERRSPIMEQRFNVNQMHTEVNALAGMINTAAATTPALLKT